MLKWHQNLISFGGLLERHFFGQEVLGRTRASRFGVGLAECAASGRGFGRGAEGDWSKEIGPRREALEEQEDPRSKI